MPNENEWIACLGFFEDRPCALHFCQGMRRDSQPVIHSFSLPGHSGTTPTIQPSNHQSVWSCRNARAALPGPCIRMAAKRLGPSVGLLKKPEASYEFCFHLHHFFRGGRAWITEGQKVGGSGRAEFGPNNNQFIWPRCKLLPNSHSITIIIAIIGRRSWPTAPHRPAPLARRHHQKSLIATKQIAF